MSVDYGEPPLFPDLLHSIPCLNLESGYYTYAFLCSVQPFTAVYLQLHTRSLSLSLSVTVSRVVQLA